MTEQNMADDSVNGLSFDERMKEIARENDISLDGQVTDEPQGEGEQVVEEQEVQSNEPDNKTDETSEVVDEVAFEDPFGLKADSDIDSQSSDTEEPTEQEENAEYPKGFKKQLKRNKRTISRLENELEEYRNELNQFKTSQQNQVQQQQPQYTRENFASDAEYASHVQSLDTNQQVDARVSEYMKQLEAQQQQQQQMIELKSSWDKKIEDNFAETDREDYLEAVTNMGNPAELFDSKVTQYMFDNPNGPRMLKYFADNPDAIQMLNNMHEYDKGAVLTKLSQAVNNVSKPVQASKPSQATPIGGLSQNAAGTNVKPIDSMSDAEQLALYRAGKWKL
jgi:hypothetical protein